jgi:hypothetical protein
MLQRFTRSYALGGLTVGEGRSVEGRIVPYEAPATVDDGEGPYLEVFTRASMVGAFQGFAARHDYQRVGLNLDHRRDSLDHRIGCAVDIRDGDDGAYATFELYDGHDLPKVRSMLETSHRGLSLDFGSRGRRRRDDGAIEHLGVHIFTVGATPTPAYAEAQILALRGGDDDEPPPPPTPMLDEMIARWGFDLASSTTDAAE